ncbi:MAG: aldehyde dehydrogenase family protein [Culicoidibacterales bacterium]
MDLHVLTDFFHSGQTRTHATRITTLKQLKATLLALEPEILAALQADLNKAEHEAYVTEFGQVLHAISEAIHYLRKHQTNANKVKTPFALFGAKSVIYTEPFGNVLVIAPWNYPLQLALVPLIGAIAAGNVAVLKPSELAPATEAILAKIIAQAFPPHYVQCVCGGVEATQQLLALKWDFICFTGSTPVGKIVMEAAAKHLTPVLLELGGKSPVIVDETADLALAARRIAYGKVLNAGQTCIAPDHVFVHETVIAQFLPLLAQELQTQWPSNLATGPVKIISPKHFQRLVNFLTQGHIYHGGSYDAATQTLEPTIMTDVAFTTSLMQEEIFGPILPVIPFSDFATLLREQQQLPQPLACYFFSQNQTRVQQLLQQLRFGNGAINDTLMQIVNDRLPFGGMGPSGIGTYHGEASIKTFSHQKSVLHQTTQFDLALRYKRTPFATKLMRKMFN